MHHHTEKKEDMNEHTHYDTHDHATKHQHTKENVEEFRLKLANLDCQSCAVNIEANVKKKVRDVKSISVNYYTGNAVVKVQKEHLGHVIDAIENMGYEVINKNELISKEHEKHKTHAHAGHHDHGDFSHAQQEVEEYKKALMSAFMFFIPSAYIFLSKYLNLPIVDNKLVIGFLELVLATGIIYAGRKIIRSGFIGVKTLNPNMDSLVFIGVMAAYTYSFVLFILNLNGYNYDLYFDTAVFILFFILLGKFLEAKAKNKTLDALNKLLSLKPKRAVVLKDGKEVEVDAKDIRKGDLVVLKPGDKVPVDGIVVEGKSELDVSTLTGESFPVLVKKDSKVLAGSVVLNGRLIIKAEVDAGETIIDEMVSLMREVMEKKTKLQNLADRVSYYFVPMVIAIAFISFVVWWMFESFSFALVAAVSVLIIACPCGLGLAIPSVIVNSIGLASKKGVLVKDIDALEKMSDMHIFAFDKTGTLTKGDLFVVKVDAQDEKKLIELAYVAEKGSNHPIAKAIREYAKKRGVKEDLKGNNYEEIAGKGVVCIYEGKMLAVGNKAMVKDMLGFEPSDEDVGKVMYVIYDKEMVGKIILDDGIKENAQEVIKFLKNNGKEVKLITGDHKTNALRIGKILGLNENEIYYEVLPTEKAKIIEELSSKGGVCYSGDGINDVVALSKADVGIAMPVSEIAVEAGDIVLLNNKIDRIVYLYRLSKYHKRKVKQNLFWAFIYNVLAIPVAAGVLYPLFGIMLKPEIAAMAMSLSSVSVVMNALSMRVFFR